MEEVDELLLCARYGECKVWMRYDYRVAVCLVRLRDFFVVGGFAEDVLVFAVVLGERRNEGVDFGRRHVATEFAIGGKLFQQAAFTGGGRGFQILAFGFFRLLVGVGRAVLTLGLMQFVVPIGLCFLESLFLLAAFVVIVLLSGVEQADDKGQYAFSRSGGGYQGKVEMRRIEGVLIEEADVGEEGSATAQAAQQYDVPFAQVAGVLYALFEQCGQSVVNAVGNVGRTGAQFVVFLQQIRVFESFIGRLGGVI